MRVQPAWQGRKFHRNVSAIRKVSSDRAFCQKTTKYTSLPSPSVFQPGTSEFREWLPVVAPTQK